MGQYVTHQGLFLPCMQLVVGLLLIVIPPWHPHCPPILYNHTTVQLRICAFQPHRGTLWDPPGIP